MQSAWQFGAEGHNSSVGAQCICKAAQLHCAGKRRKEEASWKGAAGCASHRATCCAERRGKIMGSAGAMPFFTKLGEVLAVGRVKQAGRQAGTLISRTVHAGVGSMLVGLHMAELRSIRSTSS